MSVPLIVGEAPSERAPREALGPGSPSGRMLLELLGGRPHEAANLLPLPLGPRERWPTALEGDYARALLPRLEGREVVLLGRRVSRAFGRVAPDLAPIARASAPFFSLAACRAPRCVAWIAPHPSPRSRWWNDELERRRARRFFGELLGTLSADELARASRRLSDTGLLRRWRRWRRARLLWRARALRALARSTRLERFVERVCESMRESTEGLELLETGGLAVPDGTRRREFRDTED